MRYIGSKQRLLDAIVDRARRAGLRPGETVLDVFSGTAAVGRRFKEEGQRVVTNDRMRLSWVLQRALVVADRGGRTAERRALALESAPPIEGFVSRHYAPLGPERRGFFHPDAARAIDGALGTLRAWRDAREVSDDVFFLLLAGILEGASAVANISGTFGAFLKSWQTNALQPFRVRTTAPVARATGTAPCEAYREDGNALVRTLDCDLLYIDPPYNGREYCANYHVLEAIAESALLEGPALEALEAGIYGKTGLLPYERSRYCSRRAVEDAFRDLIAGSRARCVIVSYSEEGLLGEDAIRAALADGLGTSPGQVALDRVAFRRFRSDQDRDEPGRPRRYRKLEGRARDRLHEWLFVASRPARRPGHARAAATRETREQA